MPRFSKVQSIMLKVSGLTGSEAGTLAAEIINLAVDDDDFMTEFDCYVSMDSLSFLVDWYRQRGGVPLPNQRTGGVDASGPGTEAGDSVDPDDTHCEPDDAVRIECYCCGERYSVESGRVACCGCGHPAPSGATYCFHKIA